MPLKLKASLVCGVTFPQIQIYRTKTIKITKHSTSQGFQANLAFTTVHCIYLKPKSKSSKCFQLVGLSTFALKCEDLMVLGFPKRECTRGAAGQQKIKQPVPEESSQV